MRYGRRPRARRYRLSQRISRLTFARRRSDSTRHARGAMEHNRIKAGTAVLKRNYRCWRIEMQGTELPRFVAEESWCFFGEGQTLLQLLNRMDDQAVNEF